MGNVVPSLWGTTIHSVTKKSGIRDGRPLVIPKEVLKVVVENAGIFDLKSLGGTNRKLRSLTRTEVDRRVLVLIDSFSLDPQSTLLLLRNASAYISGSAVLAVIDPGMFEPGDLDIYVPMAHAHEVWVYLWQRRNRGWGQLIDDDDFVRAGLPIPDDEYCGIPGIAAIWYFKHANTGKVINVIVTRTRQVKSYPVRNLFLHIYPYSSALPAIIRFHSTVVMNVISYFGVVALYGSLTRARVGFTTKEGRLSGRDLRCLEKYRERGYVIYRDSRLEGFVGTHLCGSDGRCSQTYRSLHDDEVFVAPFASYMPQRKTDLLQSMEDVLLWRLKNNRCYRSCRDSTALIVTSEGDTVDL
ncbi:hypothetical protein CC2G_005544 [Coprinopsis cinerea AmutBmut pab1-1]|nr:hypothetical protein CC2G_005544 [Coprinopsis cinerea AmutBmut pab1-1]